MKPKKIEKVNIADIKLGPIQHETLEPKLLSRIKTIYDMVGHYSCSTLEEWEIGFMRDLHPEREIAVWARVALAWKKYHEVNLNGQILSDEKENDLVNILISFTLGVENEAIEEIAGKEVMNKLKECYIDPN
jgi:hypothetical protein